MPHKLIRVSLLVLALGACAQFRRAPVPVNTPELPVASDTAADSLLVDVQRVDSSIVVELRYATSNNFTGAPLPGYQGNHAYLRDEVAVALSLANADLHRDGFGLKIFMFVLYLIVVPLMVVGGAAMLMALAIMIMMNLMLLGLWLSVVHWAFGQDWVANYNGFMRFVNDISSAVSKMRR